MTSRYGSHLNANRAGGGGGGLFDNYDQSHRMSSRSPARPGSGFGNRYASTPDHASTSSPYNATASSNPYSNSASNNYSTYEPSGPSFSAYPTPNTSSTPQRKPAGDGGMSMAELEHMESQSDEQISGILGKIGRLKDMSNLIGEEIRGSSGLADKMNDEFSGAGVRLRGTMRRMLRMAERTGVGWRVWLGFFGAVVLLFWYVWLF